MELVYIWIERYGRFFEQGFNFNPKYKFTFNYKKNTIVFEVNNENFNIYSTYNKENFDESGQLVNVTAVVGNNGAGKTSLLNIIRKNLSYGCLKTCKKILVAYKMDKKIKFYSSFNINRLIIESKEDDLNEIMELNDRNIHVNSLYNPQMLKGVNINTYVNNKDFLSTCMIYHTNVFNTSDYSYNNVGNVYDLSICGLINRYYELLPMNHMVEKKEKILNYINCEMENQINFLLEYRKIRKKQNILLFDLPLKLNISFVNDVTLDESIKSKLKNNINILNIFQKIDISNSEKNEENWKEKFCSVAMKNLFYEVFNKPYFPNNADENIKVLSGVEMYKSNSFISSCINMLCTIKRKFQESNSVDVLIVKKYIKLLKWVDKYYSKLNQCIRYDSGSKKMYFSLNANGMNLFFRLFNKYKQTCFNYNYLNFQWNLSSGENTLLGIYSRIHSIKKEQKNGGILSKVGHTNHYCNNVILLLDEADLTLHPRWQQHYIKSIINFVKVFLKGCKIQIIIATHSPIILSDIPKANIIFLKKEYDKNIVQVQERNSHEQTFAANISALFYDSFFMKEGSIGDIAKEKINELINALTPKKELNRERCEELIYPSIESVLEKLNVKSKKEVIQLIDIIGEPIIKLKLKSMLDMCKSNVNNKWKEKMIIENQINELKHKLKLIEDGENNDTY